MLIVRTTKARQSNLHDAGTIFWFTAGFGCKPPEIYPASTEPYWARIAFDISSLVAQSGLRSVQPFHSNDVTHRLRDHIDLDEPDLVTDEMQQALTALLDDAQFNNHDTTFSAKTPTAPTTLHADQLCAMNIPV